MATQTEGLTRPSFQDALDFLQKRVQEYRERATELRNQGRWDDANRVEGQATAVALAHLDLVNMI